MAVTFKRVLSSRLTEAIVAAPEFPCDYVTACHILHAIHILKWSRDRASFYFHVNVGTVSKIARGLSHNGASPLPF